MREAAALLDGLDALGLEAWATTLAPLLAERLGPGAHGDIEKWRSAIDQLPQIPGTCEFDTDVIGIAAPEHSAPPPALRDALLQLCPWRKGPFDVHGVRIDTEWRSDFKWNRLCNRIESLAGRRVLDVGCGNGYFALRMRGAGARSVLGIDPTLLFLFQFLAIQHFAAVEAVQVLPMRLNEMPAPPTGFDTTFSMGVLYHQRDPLEHLRQLRDSLRSGGQLVLETLILPGAGNEILEPPDRYARMRNVWHLPTISVLESWLAEAGIRNVETVDQTPTTIEEQRSTEWMPFESLANALDPEDPARTVEGWPAPLRAIVIGNVAS